MALKFLRLRTPSIFISYRREDTHLIVGRIFDRLADQFGKSSIFMDIEDMPIGSKFRQSIADVLERCDVLLAIIGPQWAGMSKQGQTRIFDKGDVLRSEIEIALAKGIVVIPVLIDHTLMPTIDALPPGLHPLTEFHAAEVSSGRDFDNHMRRLIHSIEQSVTVGPLVALTDSIIHHPARFASSAAVLLSLCLGAFYFLSNLPRRATDPNTVQAAIQACNIQLALNCVQAGGAYGTSDTAARIRDCKSAIIVRSDEPSLQWKDVWTTSVYSFAPGGGYPGGGRDDDELKVGGWGDWYFSLIQFNLPVLQRRPQFAAIALFSKASEGSSVPLALDRIIQRWDFPKGDRLWWKDRPGSRAITTESLPAPRKEQWYLIDLTELTQEWFDGKFENYGIQIRPTANYGSFVVFVSSDAPDKNKIPRLLFCM